MKLLCILSWIWLLSSTVLSTYLEDIKGQVENDLWDELLLHDQRPYHAPEDPKMMVKDAVIEMNPSEKYYFEDVLAEDEYFQPQNGTVDQESALKPTERVYFPSIGKPLVTHLAIGPHTYCGPYTQHYSSDQCTLLEGISHNHTGQLGVRPHTYSGLSVRECEKDHCDKNPKCNAITWSHLREFGCFLYNCNSNDKPMPRGDNPDFVSFSKFEPDAIRRRCVKPSGSYDTPLTFCGPYHNDFPNSQCKHIENIHHGDEDLHGPIECETLCMRNPSCTAFSHSPKQQHGCVLRDCGSNPPLPNGTNTDWLSYTKTRPLHASNCH